MAPASKILITLLFFSIFLFLPLMNCMYVTSSNLLKPLNGLRIDLFQIDPLFFPNSTSAERLQRAVQRNQARYEELQHRSTVKSDKLQRDDQIKDIITPLDVKSATYLIRMTIGTPGSTFSAVLDTGGNLVWIKCKPCTGCPEGPIFDPSKSRTYGKIACRSELCPSSPQFSCKDNGESCGYTVDYGDTSNTSGILVFDAFSVSSHWFPNITFGCSQDNEGDDALVISGVAGFGRGHRSLVSQIGTVLGNKFSYCLVSVLDSPTETSPLFIGENTSMNGSTVGSIPMFPSTQNLPFYYLSLQGISVNGQSLNIPAGTFDLQPNGTGGLIIDSGTLFTHLPQVAYDSLTESLSSLITYRRSASPITGLDFCFSPYGLQNSTFPTVTFNFNGADYDLLIDSYVIPVNDISGNIVFCLAMLPTPKDGDVSVFGIIPQQNHRILYDNDNNLLSFSRESCDVRQ